MLTSLNLILALRNLMLALKSNVTVMTDFNDMFVVYGQHHTLVMFVYIYKEYAC